MVPVTVIIAVSVTRVSPLVVIIPTMGATVGIRLLPPIGLGVVCLRLDGFAAPVSIGVNRYRLALADLSPVRLLAFIALTTLLNPVVILENNPILAGPGFFLGVIGRRQNGTEADAGSQRENDPLLHAID